MTDIPRVLGKRYEIGDLIGRGGMAQVHLGYDTRLSRTVAIKILRTDLAADPMFLARFRREAQSAAALNHPSIVSVYDTGEEAVTTATGVNVSLPYIVMEYVKGRTVASLLKTGTPLPIEEAVQVVVGVLSALEYSHHEGIIHRDIKPGNVMLTPDGKVKVMDFGIARAVADSAATMTQTNSVVGTAQYLSPEQARGEVVDARSDLYSAGCLLYELLTGKPPFTGDSAVSVAYQHVSEAPTPAAQIFPDIPDSINRVVMKSLAKAREQRYQNANEFRLDLLAAARGEGVSAPAVAATQVVPASESGQATTRMAPPPLPPAAKPSAAAPALTTTGIQPVVEEKQAKRKNVLYTFLGIAFLIAALLIGYFAFFNNKAPEEPEPTPTATSVEVAVPSLNGMTEEQARKALEERGLKFSRGTDQASDTVEKGKFVASSPEPGANVERGANVTVHFSSGPASTSVPDVTGKSFTQAQQILTDAGFTIGNITTSNDPRAAKDTVISTTPAAGSSADSGSAVDLTISSGLATLPDVRGLSEEDATVLLQDAGFSVVIIYQSENVNETQDNKVLTQSPAGGDSTTAEQRSKITITIGRFVKTLPDPSPSSSSTPSPSTPAP